MRWGSVVSEDPFMTIYCPDKYEAQRMCDKAVDGCLATLMNGFLQEKSLRHLIINYFLMKI